MWCSHDLNRDSMTQEPAQLFPAQGLGTLDTTSPKSIINKHFTLEGERVKVAILMLCFRGA